MPGYIPPEWSPEPLDPLTGEPLAQTAPQYNPDGTPVVPRSGAEGIPVNSLYWHDMGAVDRATELAQNAAAYDARNLGQSTSNLPNEANALIPPAYRPSVDPRAPVTADGQQFPAVEGGTTEDTYAPDVVATGERLPTEDPTPPKTTDVTDRIPASDGDVAVKYGEGKGEEAYNILRGMGVDHDKAQAVATDVASAQAVVGHQKQVDAINADADAEIAKNLDVFTKERASLEESYRLGFEKRARENEQRQMALEERIQKNRESPSGAWNNMSGFSKLMTTLSLITGAAAEAVSKDGSTKNPALPLIMKAIDLDMQSTRSNRAADLQLLQELRVGNREAMSAAQEAQELKLAEFTRRAASVLGEIERKRAGARTKLEQDFLSRTKTDLLSSIKDAYARQSEAEEVAHQRALKLKHAELENGYLQSRIQTENAKAGKLAGVRSASTGTGDGGGVPQTPAGTDFDPTRAPELWAWDNDPDILERRRKDKSFTIAKLKDEFVYAGDYTEDGQRKALFIDKGDSESERQQKQANIIMFREAPGYIGKIDSFIQRIESAGPAALDAKFGKTEAEKELQEYASWIRGKLITLSGKQNLLGNLTADEVKTQTALFTGQTDVLKNLSGREVARAMRTTRRILSEMHEETLRNEPRLAKLGVKLPVLGSTKQTRATDPEKLASAQSQYESAKAARDKLPPGSPEYTKADTAVRAAASKLKTESQQTNFVPRTETGEQARKRPSKSDPEYKDSTTDATTAGGYMRDLLRDTKKSFAEYTTRYNKAPEVGMEPPAKKAAKTATQFAELAWRQVKDDFGVTGSDKLSPKVGQLLTSGDAGIQAMLSAAQVGYLKNGEEGAKLAIENWAAKELQK